jgi:hypothetical protein
MSEVLMSPGVLVVPLVVIAAWCAVGLALAAAGYWMMFGSRRPGLFCPGVVLTVFGGVTSGTALALTLSRLLRW